MLYKYEYRIYKAAIIMLVLVQYSTKGIIIFFK